MLAPGSSLGGARPKATVKDVDGSLWIAKFPSKNDEYDMGAWEKTVLDLAKLCNLNVPETKLMKFSKLGSTFLVKRFDRALGKRIHFMSAMTALGKKDGDNSSGGISYLDIAAFISANGANPKADLNCFEKEQTDYGKYDELVAALQLSALELAILNCYMNGMRQAEVCAELGIGRGTINHRKASIRQRYYSLYGSL